MHYGQSELAAEPADKIGDGIQIVPWHMPYSVVRYDRNGRIVKKGRPKSDFEPARRIAKDEERIYDFMNKKWFCVILGLRMGRNPAQDKDVNLWRDIGIKNGVMLGLKIDRNPALHKGSLNTERK